MAKTKLCLLVCQYAKLPVAINEPIARAWTITVTYQESRKRNITDRKGLGALIRCSITVTVSLSIQSSARIKGTRLSRVGIG
jgi:hypothetical protein